MVGIANVEQARAWDGQDGSHWAEHSERYDTVSRRAWKRFLDADLVLERDQVLDIGCGNGRSTRDAARIASSGSASGVDLSAAMLTIARERSQAERLTNVSFVQADAQVHRFEDNAFDVAISSFGAMFFGDPTAAFTNIARAVRPGGRLALLAWRDLAMNEWVAALRGALAVGRSLPDPPLGVPGPFSLADSELVRGILGDAGFDDINFDVVEEPMEFGADTEDAFGFVRTLGTVQGLTQDLDDVTKARALDAVHGMLAAHATEEGVLLGSSAWLITAQRH